FVTCAPVQQAATAAGRTPINGPLADGCQAPPPPAGRAGPPAAAPAGRPKVNARYKRHASVLRLYYWGRVLIRIVRYSLARECLPDCLTSGVFPVTGWVRAGRVLLVGVEELVPVLIGPRACCLQRLQQAAAQRRE